MQAKCSCARHASGEVCAECQRKGRPLGSCLQRTDCGVGLTTSLLQKVLSSPGKQLDAGTRAVMEPQFGHDFSRVRIHADAAAAESALAVNALAYTVGRDIVFAADRYAPATPAGRGLLAHELTHVVQQGVVAADIHHLQSAPSGDHLEREAERFASLSAGARVTPTGAMRVTRYARPSYAPPSLQRSATFVDGPVTKPFNLAERFAKGERDAGNTDFVLNGTPFIGGTSADTLHKALHAPEVETTPSKTPGFLECWFKSAPDNVGSYDMKLPKPGKWSYETTKVRMAALFPKVTACTRAQGGSSNFVIKENETVEANVATHETHHARDYRTIFQDIVVDWDNRIKTHLGPTAARKDDKPAPPPKQENKPPITPKKEDKPVETPKKEGKGVEAPKKEDKPAEILKKEDKPTEVPKKDVESAPAQAPGLKVAGKDKNSCQDILYRIVAGQTGLKMNPDDVVDRIVTSINKKANDFHDKPEGRRVEIFNVEPGEACNAVRAEVR